MELAMKSEAELRQTLAELEELDRLKTYGGQIHFFNPYPKQKLFLDMGADQDRAGIVCGQSQRQVDDGGV